MKLFIQGMRRSGTTILFDALSEDESIDTYYEPFAAANRNAAGGGSGAKNVDYFEKIRAIRKSFSASYPEPFEPDLLNYGAPRDAALEFESALPPPCRGYVRFMLDQSRDTIIKFTRMACKVAALAEIDPSARFIHLVRDPRAVVASYLFGKNQRNARQYPTIDSFFDRATNYTAWSSGPISDLVMQQPEFSQFSQSKPIEDFFRVLLIWAFTFRSTRRDGLAAYGDNYRLLRHEDLTADPAATLQSLYDFIERPLPHRVVEWAQANIKKGDEPFTASSPRWREAFDRLNLSADLQAAGYDMPAPSLTPA